MSNVYIAVEALAALIILILIYANIYEVKQHSNKRNLFTKLLIANEIVVVVDAISWMHLNWKKYPILLGGLIAVTYIVPAIMQIFFSLYMYEHISIKKNVSKAPFNFIVFYSIAEGLLTLILCISGQMYHIQDGKYYSGPLENFFYILNIVSVLILTVIVISNNKKMSTHDLAAALSFCFVPFISVAITVISGLNVSVTLMSISMLLMYVMLQSENESILFGRANLDEMTGLYNRRAYEDEILNLESQRSNTLPKSDLVYASIDVNGLKTVNDNLGHAAGDELICAAAECLQSVFGKYGKVFRIGGDEFASIFFISADKINFIMESLNTVTQQWKGTNVDSLSLSVGYVEKKDFPGDTLIEIAKRADKRMYDAKTRYYSDKGIDRRGESDAHKVLCALYTKILRINLTQDNFSVINMDMTERQKEKGFSNRISEWLAGFGNSGQVHPDDLEEYLAKTNLDYMRNYFMEGKTSLTVTYRRKMNSDFKQVMMEIIPTNEYRDDDQSLYLYVKNIDL